MKIYLRIFLLLFLSTPSFCLEHKIYSISVCTTSSKEDANRCKEELLKNSNLEAFVLENSNKTYSTYLGNFNSYNEAINILNNSSNFIKKQKPFVKEIKESKKNEENIHAIKIDKKIEEVNDKIKEIDKEIINIRKNNNEKNKLLEQLQKAEETRKNIEVEIQKAKDENIKILAENQKIKESEIQAKAKIEKENQELSEKLKKENDEKNRVLEQLEKSEKEKLLAEEQKKSEESKRINAENQKIKEAEIQAKAKIEKENDEKEKRTKDKQIEIVKEKPTIPKNSDFLSYLEEMQKLNGVTISTSKVNHLTSLDNADSFENLIIKVDSTRNIMFLKGKNKDGEIIDIKSYMVSTAKTSIKKPQGVGSITSISLSPQWNPTSKTVKAFKERGIILPPVVPFGDKLNYMGAAKINLTHRVNGQDVYRIHGTLSENTIGTNESSGCIRMRNKEVVELASFLDKFSKAKSLNNISVILE